MKNYETHTETELDRVIAKRLGWKEVRGDHNFLDAIKNEHTTDLYNDERFNEWFGEGVSSHMYVYPQPDGCEHWQPSRNAEQIQRYVLPKLRNRRQVVEVDYWMRQIEIFAVHQPELGSVNGQWNDDNDMNKTILITALQVLDKLES